MITYQRETIDHLPVNFTVDGVVTTTGLKYAVVPTGQRPTVWVGPVTGTDGKPGVSIQGLTPGVYSVYVQFTYAPWVPVEPAGQFQVV